jgi:hypothetical protein
VGTAFVGTGSSGIPRVFVNGAETEVVRASGEQVDFLCPQFLPGTSFAISLEAGLNASNEIRSVMQRTAPGLLSVDGTGSGLGLVFHSGELAALPRYDRLAAPATAGEAITLFATGIGCEEDSALPRPVLYTGHDYRPITLLRPSRLAGVCEVHSTLPGGLSGSEVDLMLEAMREDGGVVRSNIIRIAIGK